MTNTTKRMRMLTKVLQVRLTPASERALRRCARRLKGTPSSVVRGWIEEAIRQQEGYALE